MKREDSKKHYKEEKPDLRKEIIRSSVLLTFLIISNFHAQIPINGFCRYREFPVAPNFTNLVAIDYNSDGYRDLVVFNPSSNQYFTLTADSKSNFGNPSKKSSSIYFTQLHSLGNDKTGKRFFVLSRKTREICEITFSKSGSFSTNSKTKLNGFASSVDVGEINADGKLEAVVVGTALDGMKILRSNGNKFFESDDIKGKVFSTAAFIDLNYDSYMDIAAVDVISNSVVLYSNSGIGDFEESRSINIGEDIKQFRSEDFNSDGFPDLAYIKEGVLQIICGDSVSSFRKKITLPVEIPIDKYSVLDFNGDGYNDVAFLNETSGSLFISFAKAVNQFYQPILYIKKTGLCDIISYVDRSGRKLVALSKDGKIFLINTVSFQDEQFSISLGELPVSIQSFDYNNDNYKDIAFIDAGSNSLKIGLSERRNLFRAYFNISLSSHPTNFIVDDFNKTSKTFFCYTKGDRAIEVIRYNFSNQTSQKIVLYASYPIADVKILRDRLLDRINISALTKERGKLYLQNLEVKDFHLVTSGILGVAMNSLEACVNLGVYKDIYYLTDNGEKIDLIKSMVDKKVLGNRLRLTLEKKKDEPFSATFATIPELFNRSKPTATLLTIRKKSILYFMLDEENRRIALRNYIDAKLPMKYYFENDFNISLFPYDETSGKIFQLVFSIKENKVREAVLLDLKGINDYLVTKLDARNRFFLCSNKIQNSLTFIKF
jgi:hypothetical protein